MNGEFRMITDIATVAPKELLFNYDELKAFLTEALRDYKALVVTEDGISDAKAKRAKLNKLAENINAYRINVKKQLMAQYDEDFKPKCDELVAMTKEASDNISAQVKAFEQREAEEKIAEIRAVYDSDSRAEAKEYCPWETIYNPKWANKGYKIEDAKEEVRAALFYTENDLASIRQMGGENTPYLLGIYKDNRDLNVCIRKSLEISAAKEREEQRKREAEEAERKARTAPEPDPEPMRLQETAEKIDLVTVDFRVTCTRAALNALGQYMKRNGIKYGRCE